MKLTIYILILSGVLMFTCNRGNVDRKIKLENYYHINKGKLNTVVNRLLEEQENFSVYENNSTDFEVKFLFEDEIIELDFISVSMNVVVFHEKIKNYNPLSTKYCFLLFSKEIIDYKSFMSGTENIKYLENGWYIGERALSLSH
jgi:hypothetical protein